LLESLAVAALRPHSLKIEAETRTLDHSAA